MLCVCMSPFASGDVLRADVTTIDAETMMNVESDAYWYIALQTYILHNNQLNICILFSYLEEWELIFFARE